MNAPIHSQGTFDHRALGLWQVCPRRFLFQEVERVRPDPLSLPFSGPLELAGRAGVGMVLLSPYATRQAVRRHMLAAFDSALTLAEAAGLAHDPDRVESALEKLEGEHLELVLLLAQDERVRGIEWTGAGARWDWLDPEGRRFAGDVGQIGLVKERIAGFGEREGEPTDLEPGTRVVVDWRFGSDLDLSPVALALHLSLGIDLLGLNHAYPGPRFRGFVGALRDLRPRKVVKDELGKVVPRFVEELNPDYLLAFAAGRPITRETIEAAEASRSRFLVDGLLIPKRTRRPNPAWIAATAVPRGPLFHEAVLAWDVLGPTIGRTVQEIEAAAQDGSPDAYPARGPLTRGCFTCPFRQRCIRGA